LIAYAPVGAQCLIFTLRRSCHHPRRADGRPPLLIVCAPVGAQCLIFTLRRSCRRPRRAYARRLWICVCATQKSPFLRHTVVVAAPGAGGVSPRGKLSLSSARIALLQWRPYTRSGAGGVSPPWNTLRMRTRNGQIHRIAVADAVCNPRQAEVRGVGRKHSQLQWRYSHPRRADARRS
jgi:hypothetical protein